MTATVEVTGLRALAGAVTQVAVDVFGPVGPRMGRDWETGLLVAAVGSLEQVDTVVAMLPQAPGDSYNVAGGTVGRQLRDVIRLLRSSATDTHAHDGDWTAPHLQKLAVVQALHWGLERLHVPGVQRGEPRDIGELLGGLALAVEAIADLVVMVGTRVTIENATAVERVLRRACAGLSELAKAWGVCATQTVVCSFTARRVTRQTEVAPTGWWGPLLCRVRAAGPRQHLASRPGAGRGFPFPLVARGRRWTVERLGRTVRGVPGRAPRGSTSRGIRSW